MRETACVKPRYPDLREPYIEMCPPDTGEKGLTVPEVWDVTRACVGVCRQTGQLPWRGLRYSKELCSAAAQGTVLSASLCTVICCSSQTWVGIRVVEPASRGRHPTLTPLALLVTPETWPQHWLGPWGLPGSHDLLTLYADFESSWQLSDPLTRCATSDNARAVLQPWVLTTHTPSGSRS